ncbi:MAG: hypothetical protein J6N71_01175, partial [Muribaculaceae bacterium]|nr:hypothetical protein [Muribaculaceae bacterium]
TRLLPVICSSMIITSIAVSFSAACKQHRPPHQEPQQCGFFCGGTGATDTHTTGTPEQRCKESLTRPQPPDKTRKATAFHVFYAALAPL